MSAITATSLIAKFIEGHVAERHPDADGQGLRWGSGAICFQLTELGWADHPRDPLRAPARRPSTQELRNAELKLSADHQGARGQLLRLRRPKGLGDPGPGAGRRRPTDRPVHRGAAHGRPRPFGAVRGKVKRTMISTPAPPSRWTWWTATSGRWHRIGCGLRTPRMS